LFLVLVGRAQAPVWDVSANHHIEKKKPMPYVNHYSFHILDAEWGHITIKISGHPPFPEQIMLNGHELLVDREISRFPHKKRTHMPGSATTPGRLGTRGYSNVVGTRDYSSFTAR
jgi:hypothetical protein